MNKLIKINEQHYVVCSDSEIKEGDFWIYICPINGLDCGDNNNPVVKNSLPKEWFEKLHDRKNYKKIIYSTQPLEEVCCTPKNQIKRYVDCIGCGNKRLDFDKIKPLSLSEVEELINGYNVEKMAVNWSEGIVEPFVRTAFYMSFKEGFNAHKELMKDKLFTIEDMKNFGLWLGDNLKNLKGKTIDEIFDKSPFALSIEWNVTFDEQGKLKLIKS